MQFYCQRLTVLGDGLVAGEDGAVRVEEDEVDRLLVGGEDGSVLDVEDPWASVSN